MRPGGVWREIKTKGAISDKQVYEVCTKYAQVAMMQQRFLSHQMLGVQIRRIISVSPAKKKTANLTRRLKGRGRVATHG